MAPPPTRDVVPGWQLINIISSSGIIFLRTNALSRSLSLKKKNVKKFPAPKLSLGAFLKKSKESSKRAVSPLLHQMFWQKSSPFFSPFCLCLMKNRFSKFFVCSLFLCCAFFHFLVLLSIFFFFGSARGFFFQQATTFDSSLKQTREKKEKDFETFLSLFFPLFDTNNTTLALTQRQRRRTKPCSFYSSSVCCKVLYRERQ